MVVMAIFIIFTTLSVRMFRDLMQESDFESSINRVYNDISSLSVNTVISRSRMARTSFYTSFSGGFFVYKENAFDPYIMELSFLSGTQTTS